MITLGNKQLCEYCLNENGGEPCRFCGYDGKNFNKELAVLPPGSALMGKYIVGKVIGKGGFGITYLAYDITTDKKVALKEYYPISYSARTDDGCTVAVSRSEDSSLYQNGMKKFYDEASLVSRFNDNPGIVSVYEFFYENGTAYFVMELLQGCSLKAYIDKHGSLTPEQALYVADKVSAALAVAHGSNVLHRDIAPDNIMICSDGEVKLIDFGAARQVSAEDQKSLSVILKQGFAPLEQYQKHGKQGPWTDLYSLGATLYYALTKKCIEDPMTRLDGDEEFQSNHYNIEPQLWEIIKHATNLRVDERYGSADEFRADLGKIPYKAQALKDMDAKPESSPAPSAAAPDIPQSVQPVNNTGIPQSYQPTGNTDIPQSVQPVNNTGVPQPYQPTGNTGVPRSVQPVNTAGVPAVSYTSAPQQNTYTPSPPKAGTYMPPPPIKKPASKGKIFGIIGGIVGLVAIIAIIIGVSSSSSASKPPSEPSGSSTTTSGSSSGSGTADHAEVTIAGETYSTNVTSLTLSNKKLANKDIQDLKYFTKLEKLYIQNNRLTDLSPLSSLTNLKELYCANNDVSSLEFIKGMKKLEIVDFSENNISDLSPLSGLTSLTEISIYDNPIKSLEPLRNLTKVKRLIIGDCPSLDGDLGPLSGMKSLELLYASNCNISDISAISGCKSLAHIDFGGNTIYDISPLKDCQEIKLVTFYENTIDTIDQLEIFYDSLFELNYSEDATVDIRDIGWLYNTYEYAQEDLKYFLDVLESKGYSTDKFSFRASWYNANGEEKMGFVKL